MVSIDLSTNKKFGNKKINLKGATESTYLDFDNGMSEQVKYYRSGGNIVVKVYAQKQYTFTKSVVFHDNKKVGFGPNKNKYEKYTNTYKGTLVGEKIKWTLEKAKVTYESKKGNGEETTTFKVLLNGKTVYKDTKAPNGANYQPSLDTTKVLGTYTITNIGKQESGGVDVYLSSEDYNNESLIGKAWDLEPNKKGVVTGTNLKETASSTSKNETFNMKGGEDTINFNNSSNQGKDTVKISKNSNTNLKFQSGVSYEKDGNNVIISSGNNGQVTLQNFFNNEDATIKINNNNLVNILNGNSAFNKIGDKDLNKSQTIKGTFLKEALFGGNSGDKIYTGSGDDSVTANKGNDKIYITGKGNKTINITNADGNDTVYDSHKADKLKVVFSDADFVSYIKSGNNLIIQGYTGQIDNYKSASSTTIKDWFKHECKLEIVNKSTTKTTDLMADLKSNKAKLFFANTKSITGTNYSDQIYGGLYTKSIDAKEGNNYIEILDIDDGKTVNIKAGKGNDTYQLDVASGTHIISDAGGSDKLIIHDDISGKSDYKMFFNVTKDGKADTTLHLFSTKNCSVSDIAKNKKITDTATIKNYLTSNRQQGTGYIEQFTLNGSAMSAVNLESVASQVASWLSSGGRNYGSAMDVIKSKDATAINSLLQLYTVK